MQSVTAPRYLSLNVWSLTLGSACAALVLGIVVLPVKMLAIHHRMGYGITGPGPGPGTVPGPDIGMYHAAFASLPWHIVALLAIVILVGIGGAIIAAVYNASLPKA